MLVNFILPFQVRWRHSLFQARHPHHTRYFEQTDNHLDPFGVLEEGEIYFRCSEPIGEALTIDPASFSGSVLVCYSTLSHSRNFISIQVMRNPTMVASDVQKVNFTQSAA